ncbi:MAG: peptidylprolyl isomerase [Nitrospirota bacterium]|nr:peptidylprolyl isomerase [Nitrospirota bacterium]
MRSAKPGDVVRVHYTGTLEDQTVFDSSEGRDPLILLIGEGEVIPGFEEALLGMTPGQTKNVHIPCDRAYGPYNDNMLMDVDRSDIPPDIPLESGLVLQVEENDGIYPMMVKSFNDQTVTLDSNHPLAGRDLNFTLTLVEIVRNLTAGSHGNDCGCGG